MQLYIWPNIPGVKLENSGSGFEKFMSNLQRDDSKLFDLTRSIINKLEQEGNDLSILDPGYNKKLKIKNVNLWELRIPAHHRKKGVLRLYHCTDRRYPNSIIILDWQIKTNDKDSANIKRACKRYKELKNAI